MQTLFYVLLGLLPTLGSSSPVHVVQNATVFDLEVEGCGLSNYERAPNTPDRIIGGRRAYVGEFPWIVSVRERDSLGYEHVCGGAIINEYWIVTAAHCFDSTSTRTYDVVVGLQRLSQLESRKAKIHKLSKIIPHSRYRGDGNFNDIALLKTRNPIDIEGSGGLINGICFPEPGSDPRGYATVSGWGHRMEDGENSDYLRTVDVPIVLRKVCNERYDDDPYDKFDEIVDSMICAGSKGRDACQSDSGGPLVQYRDGRAILIGVVSFGTGCGTRYYPGVYTRVSSFLDWIKKNAV